MMHSTPDYSIEMMSATRGYFEHNTRGEDSAGGLWFDENKVLIDYDGVFELPKSVIATMIEQGYNMDYASEED